MARQSTPVAVIGGGVIGAAVAYALARRRVGAVLLEAEGRLALAASGTNSGMVHTGFDSEPGALETRLMRRSAALRDAVLDELAIPVLRCGALLRPRGPEEAATVAALARRARENGVTALLGADGALGLPGEAVTDPVAYTLALAAAAARAGVEVRTRARVVGIDGADGGLVVRTESGDEVACDVAVNCAGLHADAVARLAGDDSFAIFPRKGEFLVFDAPAGRPLEHILLPVPTARTKGVLAFPTLDGRIVVGPTAHDQEDKGDWSVRREARDELLAKAGALVPQLAHARPAGAYAGLRPAGRGTNYAIGPSSARPQLVNVAAIRSTGLSASLGIGEHVAGIVGGLGVAMGPDRPLAPGDPPKPEGPWWRRTAEHHAREDCVS